MKVLGHYDVIAGAAKLVEKLPALVRKQRRLEASLVPFKPIEEEEKAIRQEIDQLLVGAGLKTGEAVVCLGYEVAHNERRGRVSLNQDQFVEKLVAGGVDRDFAMQALAESMETGDPSSFASVKPAKGAKVRNS